MLYTLKTFLNQQSASIFFAVLTIFELVWEKKRTGYLRIHAIIISTVAELDFASRQNTNALIECPYSEPVQALNFKDLPWNKCRKLGESYT